jgi:hypothetical protein
VVTGPRQSAAHQFGVQSRKSSRHCVVWSVRSGVVDVHQRAL